MNFATSSFYWFSFGEIIEREILSVKIKLINDQVFLFEYNEELSNKFDELKNGDSIIFWFEDNRNGKRKIKEIELDF